MTLQLTSERIERRLVAILAMDVAGYSRLMGTDEEGTLRQLKACLHDLAEPKIAEHRGHVIKTTGDGMLVEFGSVVDALRCAVEIQRGMAERNRTMSADKKIEFRMGINIGDIIIDGDDIFGNGVNIAARLESIADRGGICISRQVLDQVEDRLDLTFRERGRQNLKNIAKPVEVYGVDIGEPGGLASRVLATANLTQEIRYCQAPDGVRLAYAKVGSGPPLVRSAHWLGHLEYDWELPVYRPMLLGLAQKFTLVRYDARGNGLSDWDVGEISLDAWVSDLETVVDAAGLKRFPLLGFSQGCAVSIAFAVRHPQRVSHLILCGGFAVGRYKQPNMSDADRERFIAMAQLIKLGWGADEPTFRQIFTSRLVPTATKEQAEAFNELERKSASPECAMRYFQTVNNFDVRSLLPQVRRPTLVMHARDEIMVPVEWGRELAAGIPGARFIALPGKNHIMLEGDPGMPRFYEEIENFVKTEA